MAASHFGVSGEAKEREMVSFQTIREETQMENERLQRGREGGNTLPLVSLQTREGKMEEQAGKSEIRTSARSFLLPAHDGDSQEEGKEMALVPWF